MATPRDHIDHGLRHERSGALAEALEEYQTAARLTRSAAVLAEASRRRADVLRLRCEWSEALDAARHSAEVARKADLPELLAEALNAEALVLQSRGDNLGAIELHERVLALTEDDRLRGIAHQNLGTIAAIRGELDAAEMHFQTSYDLFRRAAYLRGSTICLLNYGGILNLRKDFARAEPVCELALAAAQSVEDRELTELARLNLAEVLAHRGDPSRAQELVSAALGYFSQTENRWRRLEALSLLGDLRAEQGDHGGAEKCFSEALDLAQSIGALLEAAPLIDRLEKLRPTP